MDEDPKDPEPPLNDKLLIYSIIGLLASWVYWSFVHSDPLVDP